MLLYKSNYHLCQLVDITSNERKNYNNVDELKKKEWEIP
jgi:hypothetical protein